MLALLLANAVLLPFGLLAIVSLLLEILLGDPVLERSCMERLTISNESGSSARFTPMAARSRGRFAAIRFEVDDPDGHPRSASQITVANGAATTIFYDDFELDVVPSEIVVEDASGVLGMLPVPWREDSVLFVSCEQLVPLTPGAHKALRSARRPDLTRELQVSLATTVLTFLALFLLHVRMEKAARVRGSVAAPPGP